MIRRSLMEGRKALSSSFRIFSPSSSTAMTLFALVLLQRSWFGACDSFCLSTLSRSYCPDLQTFDQFNISSYGGRWYEIGSNGYFKNFEEAGGTCVTADYGIVTNVTKAGNNNAILKKSPTLSVLNSFNKQIGPIATSVVQGISLRAGEVCQQARQICRQTHQQGELFLGLSLVDGLASKIVPNFSLEGDGLIRAKFQIEDAVQKINESLELLASNISQLQLINSNISQALGDQYESVDTLTDLARQGSAGAEDILVALHEISMARFQVAKIAGLLFGISNAETYIFGENSSLSTEQAAVQLFKAASLIQTAEETMHGPLSIIKATLAGAAQSTSMLNVDETGPSGSTPFLQGQASPMLTGNHSGRLVMNSYYYPDPTAIPDSWTDNNNNNVNVNSSNNNATTAATSTPLMTSSTAGNYWILAAEGKPETGYDAALVYGCHEQPAGGVKEPLFILSRKPFLPQNVTDKFFNVIKTLGIDQECAEPFVFTEQGDSCIYPPVF